jgi:alpha-mannosidase
MIPEIQIFKNPLLVARLLALKKRVYKKISELNCSYIKDVEPISYDKIHEKKFEFKTIKKGETWGKAYDCAFFHIEGKIPEKYLSKNIFLVFDFQGEAFYLDEKFNPYFSVNSRLSLMDYFQFSWDLRTRKISEKEKEKGIIDCFLDTSFNGKIIQPFGKARFFSAYISECNDLLKEYYYDYLYFSYLYCSLEKGEIKRKLGSILDKSYYLLKKSDFIDILNAKSYLTQAYSLSSARPKCKVSAIGQAHLDMAWLWPLRETKRKAARTYINTINLIENYPFYIFGTSQPQQLEWTKQLYPDIYNKIKEDILKGNVELQGGMWVEPDCNLPSGESLVRQIIYGKKFFKKEFDIDVKTCWLVDSFGFPGSLPQILKKSGLDYFCTIKLFWNNFNKFPYTTFLWEGIDGSKVLSHMPPEGTYTSEASAVSLKLAENQFKEKNLIDSFLLVFGNGDGGGGPQPSHLELLDRFRNTNYTPELSFEKAIDFFNKIEKDKDKLPIYKGELYLEKHQGTYTTQAKNKFFNRKIEIKLHNLEALATLAYLKGYKYPSSFIEEIYKEVLLYQFHDILPGSAVKEVYDETKARYKILFEKCDKLQNELIGFLSLENKLPKEKKVNTKKMINTKEVINIKEENVVFGINLTGF